ncbi:beta strand repeat-containing protein [Spirosoma fluminis]
MKKIILTSAALFGLAIVAHAQFVNQVGNQQAALQEQTGNDQTGTINQVQSPNDPNRTNYGNYAITFQGIPNNTGPNTATINQNDGSQGNRAGIAQGGGNNNALIEQNGGPDGLSGGTTSASATIGAAGGDGNFGGILQQGVNNIAVLSQRNNSRQNGSEIYQNGLDFGGLTNTAVVIQSNNSVNNDAFIFQGYSAQNVAGMAVSGNQAYIYQGRTYAYSEPITAESANNYAVITQLTNNNIANVYQGGTVNGQAGDSFGSVASILQQGEATIANIYQGTGGGKSVGSRASSIQTGRLRVDNIFQGYGATGSDRGSTASMTSAGVTPLRVSDNTIFQGYRGVSEENQATIQQTADGGAQILQSAGMGSYGANNKAIVTQNGPNNVGAVVQISTRPTIYEDLPYNSAATSVGRDNTATILQATGTAGSYAVVDQGTAYNSQNLQASGNTATVNQLVGIGLFVSIFQGGDALKSLGYAPESAYGGRETEAVVKLGSVSINNTAQVTQAGGNSHSSNVRQGGQMNSAQVTQSGGNASRALVVQGENTRSTQAIITQTSAGYNNQAIIYQFANVDANGVGVSNTALISQIAGSGNVAVAQQGRFMDSSPSSNNFLHITQNGSENRARMAQVGNNNYADVTQVGNNNRLVDALGTAGSFATQQGNNNRLTLIQNAGSGPGQTYKYTQIGDNNTQVVTQNAN